MLGGNVDYYVSLSYIRGYDLPIYPFCVYLGDMLRKIMWTTFFKPSYDFSTTINKVKKIFILFGVILVIASYLVFSKL